MNKKIFLQDKSYSIRFTLTDEHLAIIEKIKSYEKVKEVSVESVGWCSFPSTLIPQFIAKGDKEEYYFACATFPIRVMFRRATKRQVSYALKNLLRDVDLDHRKDKLNEVKL